MIQIASSFLDLITIHNRFPDCLDLDLDTAITESSTSPEPQFDLALKLNCHQQWENILGGRIKFAIKGGRLQLILNNCLIESESRLKDGVLEFAQPFSPSVASILVNTEEITTTSHQEILNWSFTCPFPQLTLTGIFEKIELGKVKITSDQAEIIGHFWVSPQDIYLTDAEGLWKHDLSPNKHSILDRLIVKFLIENRFQSSLTYFHLGVRINQTKEQISLIEEENFDQLQETINNIINAKTDHFLELAEIANLNPKIDFAGGNLTATNLRGLDLSESNFFRANFRGADLTDIDLSDSNLQGCRLSGADLSGAYLENANLKFSYCSGTSFALCNLIGSNLSYAYLGSANLENANLTNAQTDGTEF